MRYIASLIFCALLGLLAAGPADAQPYRAREGVQNGQVRSLDQILNGIRRDRPGNLADVQGPNFGPSGDARYRLKWVSPDGRVQWLDTDARTGRVLGVEGADRGRPNFAPPRPNFAPRGQNFAPPDGQGGPDPRFDRGRGGAFNRGGAPGPGPDDSGDGRRGGFNRGGGPDRGNDNFGGFQRGAPRGNQGGNSEGDGRRRPFGRFGR